MTDAVNAQRYLLAGYWGHCFFGSTETGTRFIYDTQDERIVRAQISAGALGGFVEATEEQRADIEDSLKNANEDALLNPAAWDLEFVDSPEFADEAVLTPPPLPGR